MSATAVPPLARAAQAAFVVRRAHGQPAQVALEAPALLTRAVEAHALQGLDESGWTEHLSVTAFW